MFFYRYLFLYVFTHLYPILAQTVTLYDVEPSITSGLPVPTNFSAIGVGSDGATTYVVVVVVTADPIQIPNITTFTSTFPAVTETLTAVIGASSAYISKAATLTSTGTLGAPEFNAGQVENCTYDGQGGGSCVVVYMIDYVNNSVTLTETYTGSVVPIYTLTVGGGNGSGTIGRPRWMAAGVLAIMFMMFL